MIFTRKFQKVMPERIPDDIPQEIPEDVSENIPGSIPADLKRINHPDNSIYRDEDPEGHYVRSATTNHS